MSGGKRRLHSLAMRLGYRYDYMRHEHDGVATPDPLKKSNQCQHARNLRIQSSSGDHGMRMPGQH